MEPKHNMISQPFLLLSNVPTRSFCSNTHIDVWLVGWIKHIEGCATCVSGSAVVWKSFNIAHSIPSWSLSWPNSSRASELVWNIGQTLQCPQEFYIFPELVYSCWLGKALDTIYHCFRDDIAFTWPDNYQTLDRDRVPAFWTYYPPSNMTLDDSAK